MSDYLYTVYESVFCCMGVDISISRVELQVGLWHSIIHLQQTTSMAKQSISPHTVSVKAESLAGTVGNGAEPTIVVQFSFPMRRNTYSHIIYRKNNSRLHSRSWKIYCTLGLY